MLGVGMSIEGSGGARGLDQEGFDEHERVKRCSIA